MIVEPIDSSSSLSRGMTMSPFTRGSSCLLVSAVEVSDTEVSKDRTSVVRVLGSGKTSSTSESELQREKDNIVHWVNTVVH